MIQCLVVDDEMIARKGIERYISDIPYLSLVGSARTAISAMDLLKVCEVDLLILDIQMPQMTGLEFLKSYPNPPLTIIITAFPDYALQGFELDVIDYIVKPASFERFLKACNKAKEYLELKQFQKANNPGENYFFVKTGGRIEKILFDDILFVEAKENYSTIHTLNNRYLVLQSMKNLETVLHPEKFMRVHKSFIVALDKINGMEGHTVLVDQHKIPLSREVKPALLSVWARNGWLKR